MKILNNKSFVLFVCITSFVVSGLIFADKAFGISVRSNMDMGYGKIMNLGTPTDSYDATTKSYVDTAFASLSLPWSKLTGFPSSCSSGYYVSGVGSALTCSQLPSASTNYWTLSGSNLYNNSGSYIGIGNPSPSYKLDVAGDTRLNGNVGIGTAPFLSYKLYVSGKSVLYGAVIVEGSSRDNSDFTESGDLIVRDGITVGGRLTVSRWATFNNYVDINGRVFVNNNMGIGTVPSYKLDVSGDTRLNGYLGIGTTPNSSYRLYVYGDSYLNGNIGIGTTPSYSYKLNVSGNANVSGTFSATTKNFIIDHPLDPENKQLVHSTLEGPEIAVFYRGEAQLENGRAVVSLPDYFEALTREEGRTVLLTPKFDSDEAISNLAASSVENGRFSVRAVGSNNPSQTFYWEVKAVRADIEPLEVERLKAESEKK